MTPRDEPESTDLKIARLKLVQHRAEKDLWGAIDRISDYCQRHELLLTKLRRGQWAVLAMTASSLVLGILNLLGK